MCPSMPTILLFGPFPPNIERATITLQAALKRMMEWSSKWRPPLNPLKFKSSFFSIDPYQPCLRTSLSILNTPLNFNPNTTLLGVTFDRTLSFTYTSCFIFMEEVLCFSCVPSALSLLSPGNPVKSLYVQNIKPLFAPFSPMLPQTGFVSHPHLYHFIRGNA